MTLADGAVVGANKKTSLVIFRVLRLGNRDVFLFCELKIEMIILLNGKA